MDGSDFGQQTKIERERINEIGERPGQILSSYGRDIPGLQSSLSNINTDTQDFVNDLSVLSKKIAVREEKISTLGKAINCEKPEEQSLVKYTDLF